ncbi:class I SAM-dependent methyltransferase [Nonomuraea sp. GTA35]|uniref:class I SAM-dependent methyltransferase n=1 Tax=Nonomuraea sp. GTA35 TaxID=1676746 RepID=UPI0035BF3CBA
MYGSTRCAAYCATARRAREAIELFDYDSELGRYNERLRAAAGVRTADRVLDIGCGTGQNTRDAARSAPSVSALGVDVPGPVVERARRLSEQAGIRDARFERASDGACRTRPWRLLAGGSDRRDRHADRCRLRRRRDHRSAPADPLRPGRGRRP